MWKWYAVLSAVFAALTAILAKIGVKNVNSNVATAIRTIIILLMSWGIVLFAGEMKHVRALSRHNLLFLALSGVATGLSWLFYFKALQTGPVSKVAPIDKFSVALAILLAFIILHETPDWKTAVGGVLILAGTVIMVL
jgi:bacterial/archaeal transporter family protein